jgi:hypothetical protein
MSSGVNVTALQVVSQHLDAPSWCYAHIYLIAPLRESTKTTVSGTIGKKLTTTTTGTNHTTTFGATTVSTTLVVTSTGAVTETSSNILKVAGKGTTTVHNPDVTVNGVKGAEIPAP